MRINLWNPEKKNWERYIKCEEKKETKPITEESIEALGYACGEIQKCFTNGWVKSLKNKSLNEEDKKIEKLTIGKDDVAWCEGNMKTDEEMVDIVLEIKDKINEIIDYIMEEK